MKINSFGSLKQRPIHPNMSVEEIAFHTTNNVPHSSVEKTLSVEEYDEAYFEKIRKRNQTKELLLVEVTSLIRRYDLQKIHFQNVFCQALDHVKRQDQKYFRVDAE